MNELSYQGCIPLIEVLQKGVRTNGILRAVIAFGEAGCAPVNLSARSIGEGMTNGKDMQTSFRDAVPRLPDMILRILESGILNSVLDYALDDILLLDRRSGEEHLEDYYLRAHRAIARRAI
ncbi:MAG: hypothetical protein KAR40_01005 [Candidatus Sabulitectum sp.]|nr:hypothetical protein [Candidatus Sabulitectum sp.]